MGKLRNLILFLLFLVSCGGPETARNIYPAEVAEAKDTRDRLSFIVCSDMGRPDTELQRPTAWVMGETADAEDVDFLVVAGDPLHGRGAQSIIDKVWHNRIESIYTHPALQRDWFVISGNHEYQGSVEAMLDYSGVSERWNAPARYYSFEREIPGSGQKCLFVFLDTTPLIEKYRHTTNHPDVLYEDDQAQLRWLDSVLTASPAERKIVVGHHPIYGQTKKPRNERRGLRKKLEPVFSKHSIDLYISGHLHNFQHLAGPATGINQIVNSSASKSRSVRTIDGTVFCRNVPGFTLVTVTGESIIVEFITETSERIYGVVLP